MVKIGQIFKGLEDPKYPCLGPHMKLLTFIGVWHPNLNSNLSRFKLILFYINIAFFFSQYVKCALNFKIESLKLILQYAPFHMGVAKSCFFQKDYKKWERLINFISTTELNQLSKEDKKQDRIIDDYVKRSRKVTYFFWALALLSNFSIFSEPYQKNEIIENGTSVYVYLFDGYTPFNKDPPGYYINMFIQTVIGNMMSAYVVAWDMMVVTIMIYFAGQLRMSILYCRRIIHLDDKVTSHCNIAQCHQFHTTLVNFQKEFNDLISPVMFIYLVVICVNLGACIVQIVEIQDNLTALVSACFYMMACLVQLLLFYWHGNEVTIESERVRYSSFESDWIHADRGTQKEVALLTQATQKKLVFRAGPFNEMSLSTFISILRASYSFYTLMNKTNKEN